MNKNKEEGFCAKVVDNKLIIQIPFDTLEKSQKYRDDVSYEIYDKQKMGDYLADTIIWHTKDIGDQEVGASIFTNLIDGLFDYAYECGEIWLKDLDYDEE